MEVMANHAYISACPFVQIHDYPSLVLFAASNDTAPTMYSGSYCVQDILTFLDRTRSPVGKQKLSR